MAGGAHIFDMIKRLKENENLKNKSYFKSKGVANSNERKPLMDHVVASEEERQKIREEAARENQREIKRAITIAAICLLIGLIILSVLLFVKF